MSDLGLPGGPDRSRPPAGGGTRAPATGAAPEGRHLPLGEPPPPGLGGDSATLDPRARTLAPGGKQPLAAFPDAGPETFSSKGWSLPAGPGVYALLQAPEGDFELQVARAASLAGPVTAGVAVRANAQGDVVAVDAAGAVSIGGEPLAPGGSDQGAESEASLPGGGGVTDWGAGYVTIATAGGDAVSVFARGDHLEFLAQLAQTRLAGAVAPPARVPDNASMLRGR